MNNGVPQNRGETTDCSHGGRKASHRVELTASLSEIDLRALYTLPLSYPPSQGEFLRYTLCLEHLKGALKLDKSCLLMGMRSGRKLQRLILLAGFLPCVLFIFIVTHSYHAEHKALSPLQPFCRASFWPWRLYRWTLRGTCPRVYLPDSCLALF